MVQGQKSTAGSFIGYSVVFAQIISVAFTAGSDQRKPSVNKGLHIKKHSLITVSAIVNGTYKQFCGTIIINILKKISEFIDI